MRQATPAENRICRQKRSARFLPANLRGVKSWNSASAFSTLRSRFSMRTPVCTRLIVRKSLSICVPMSHRTTRSSLPSFTWRACTQAHSRNGTRTSKRPRSIHVPPHLTPVLDSSGPQGAPLPNFDQCVPLRGLKLRKPSARVLNLTNKDL
jgi:hypothetical protein